MAKRHSPDEQEQAVNETSGLTAGAAAKKKGVSESTIRRWRRGQGKKRRSSGVAHKTVAHQIEAKLPSLTEALSVGTIDAPTDTDVPSSHAGRATLASSQVRRTLRLSRRDLRRMRKTGEVIGVRAIRTVWFPSWQFDVTSKRVRPAVREVTQAFNKHLKKTDPLIILSWAKSRQDEDLEGETPADWIASGRPTERVAVAAQRAAVRLAQ